MSVAVKADPDKGVVKITVSGRFTLAVYKDFAAATEKITSQTFSRCVIDLRRVAYLDSAALGMLLRFKEQTGIDGKHIKIQTAWNAVADTLRISQFDQIFQLETLESLHLRPCYGCLRQQIHSIHNPIC